MLKKVAGVLLTAVLVFSVSTPGFAAAAKKGRVEGRVALTDKDKSTLTIREGNAGGGGQKTIHYDSSTKWNSQYHGDKNMNAVDPSEVKEGDYVTCVGSYDDKGEFHATIISKRLSHPK